jgi:hypothetical protein
MIREAILVSTNLNNHNANLLLSYAVLWAKREWVEGISPIRGVFFCTFGEETFWSKSIGVFEVCGRMERYVHRTLNHGLSRYVSTEYCVTWIAI